jgi:hypothetical protein
MSEVAYEKIRGAGDGLERDSTEEALFDRRPKTIFIRRFITGSTWIWLIHGLLLTCNVLAFVFLYKSYSTSVGRFDDEYEFGMST